MWAILFPETEIHVVEGLREINFGEFEGKTYEELKNRKEYKEWKRIMARYHCINCGIEIKSKDCIGANRKLISIDTTTFYCMNCFAEYLDCSVSDLQQKIEEFKEQGCTLFQ